MVYADYAYYTSSTGFAGSKLSETEFNQNRKQAQAFIDRITFHRIELWNISQNDIPDYIKDAVCDLCEKIQTFAEAGASGGLKASETVGKQSVTYLHESGATQESVMMKSAMNYIHGTKFAYRGY